MAKYLLALILVHTFVLLADTPASANPNQDSAKHTQADQNPPTQPPAVQKQVGSGNNSKPDQPESTANKPTQPHVAIDAIPRIDVRRDWVDCATLLVGILLVIVGAVTSGLIWYQAREMARATEEMRKSTTAAEKSAAAMEKSVHLQKAAMRQWLKVENWETDTPYPNPNWISLQCDIVNPTTMPLTIGGIHFRCNFVEIRTPDRRAAVGPGDRYQFRYPALQLTGPPLEDFNRGNLHLGVKLVVDFIDVFGDPYTQTVFHQLRCGREKACSVDLAGSTQPTERQNPN